MEVKKASNMVDKIGNLSEMKGQAKLNLNHLIGKRENLFYAVKRGLPDNVESVTSQYLAGTYGNHIGASLVDYAQQLESVQRDIDRHHAFIATCQVEIDNLKKNI
ncbi:hypothetical protein GZ22_18565 (plasmid) [Terribacillus saccharophilus]|uniref:DUF5082 domain-containing protein n=1 Tax=Terribacillus saccharophilus TaxID=361277 RepID=A0A075LQ17_9BACI|nr:hypothetical protein [Terribacillus goriensis]AIF68429.1 hypothetical protein GZ22_18565 [Terribacillus goriensis]